MCLSLFYRELLESNVAAAVLWHYVNNNGEMTEESVVRRVKEKLAENFTEEMRSYIGPMMAKWVQHLERKKNEYVQKSCYVTWLTDATYDLEI